MGQTTIPAVAGLTRNIQAFTSTQTWTVPSTAQYVDVLVIGGGGGGTSGYRTISAGSGYAGCGGGVLLLRDLYLGGTGTVSITIGSGGTGGVASATTAPNEGTAGTFSAFGTYGYASGSSSGASVRPGLPGYKGTAVDAAYASDTTQTNFAPLLIGHTPQYTSDSLSNAGSGGGSYNPQLYMSPNAMGWSGGYSGSSGTSNVTYIGGSPGHGSSLTMNNLIQTRTVLQNYFWQIDNSLGSASAGANSSSGGAGGAAGVKGYAGGGGTTRGISNGAGSQGGPGAGGGGACSTAGGTGGAGGAAGANTGAGGGGGGTSFSATAGTGGAGGNGGSGLVMVSWIG